MLVGIISQFNSFPVNSDILKANQTSIEKMLVTTVKVWITVFQKFEVHPRVLTPKYWALFSLTQNGIKNNFFSTQ